MKKCITLTLVCALCMALAVPAFAYDYRFSGEDSTFAKSTSTDEPVTADPLSENIRRNKDTAVLPPPYFYGSGEIPTDPSSLYHGSTGGYGSSAGYYDDTSIGSTFANTAPMYYADGSIGTLYVARTGKTIKVYEGEALDNLKKGAGHFASTSAWDGNVGLCGHNRGANAYFSFVKDLKIGDRLTYTTLYGSRTYEVFSKEQINECDYSKLCWSDTNKLTLITCIADKPQLRWAVQCREV